MHNFREAELPTDLLAGLLMEAAHPPARVGRSRDRLTLRTYAVMATTTALTFAVLASGYQLLFTHTLFA